MRPVYFKEYDTGLLILIKEAKGKEQSVIRSQQLAVVETVTCYKPAYRRQASASGDNKQNIQSKYFINNKPGFLETRA